MAEPSSLLGPLCGNTTYSAADIENLFCPYCRQPTSDPAWVAPPGFRPSGPGLYSQGPGQFPGGRIQWG